MCMRAFGCARRAPADVLLRHRVVTVAAPWCASANPPDPQPPASASAKAFNCPRGVARTGRLVTAGAEEREEMSNRVLIKTDKQNRQLTHARTSSSAELWPWRFQHLGKEHQSWFVRHSLARSRPCRTHAAALILREPHCARGVAHGYAAPPIYNRSPKTQPWSDRSCSPWSKHGFVHCVPSNLGNAPS